MDIKKILGKTILRLNGWKWEINIPTNFIKENGVLVCAPHTSNWDFFYAVAGFWALGANFKLIIKDSHTKAWYGGFIKWLGGIGIDRSKGGNTTDLVIDLFKEHNDLLLLITPEGSRSYSEKWKQGFYHIAKGAKIPIIYAAGDYKNKKCIIEGVTDPTKHSIEETFDIFKKFYTIEMAKYPEKYNPNIK